MQDDVSINTIRKDGLIENDERMRSESLDSIAVNRIPKKKKRALIVSIVLLIFGIIFLFAGIISIDNTEYSFEYVFMFLVGLVFLISGIYYIINFCLAKRTPNEAQRRNIYDKIPEL